MKTNLTKILTLGLAALTINLAIIPQAQAIKDPALEKTEILINESAANNKQPIQIKFIEDVAVEIEQPKFIFLTTNDGMLMEIRYNPGVNSNTRKLLELIELVKLVSKEALTTPVQFLEIYSNAKRGDLFAKHDILALRLLAKSKLLLAIENKTLFLYEDLTPKAKMTSKEKILARQELNVEIEALKKETALALKKAHIAEQAQLKERETKIKSTGILDAYEAQEDKLNNLILKNDRKGVRKMLEAYLPFEVMNPIERDYWLQWLEALEKPNPANSVVAFRGLDKENDKLQIATINGETRYGLMSTLLTRNQGSYTRRLRSLTTARKKIGLHTTLEEDSFIKSSGIISSAQNHSEDPTGSIFLSLTPNYATARGFSENGIAAFRIDARRLFANVGSFFEQEREILVPLIIFPDEVISLKFWPGGSLDDSRGEKLQQFDNEIKPYLAEAERLSDFTLFRQMKMKTLIPITSQLGPILCKRVF